MTIVTNLSAHSVRDLIIDRLVTGSYPIGSQLPTSRQLAVELGAHRNTVAKAYQQLAELGLVMVRQGKGTFVVSTHGGGNGSSLASQIHHSIANQIMQARRLGISECDLRATIDQQLAETYGATRRGLFVECNAGDVEAAVTDIESMTGFRLTPLLLDQIKVNPRKAVDGYDVVVTILAHIKEVSDCLAHSGTHIDVIGVYTLPDEEALGMIAQIEPGSRVGIIVDFPEGVQRFKNQINSVTSVETKALMTPTTEEIQQLSREVDVIVCNRSRAGQVGSLGLTIPVIELRFHVSRQSMARVTDALVSPPSLTASA
jgi:DNA-binding transcriptional regulator YhcF (GntR family)